MSRSRVGLGVLLIEPTIILRNVMFNPAARKFVGSRLFWAMLVVKLVVGSVLASFYARDYFIPFLNYYAESGLRDPWVHFYERGRLQSFPYQPVMLYVFAVPRLLFGWMLPGGTDTVTVGHLILLRLPLLLSDFSIALLLVYWLPYRVRAVLLLYWCSPLSLYINYWHGQLDVVPTALFLTSLFFLRRKQYDLFAVIFALALGTKSHLLITLPFILLYVGRQAGLWRTLRLCTILVGLYAILLLPFASSPAFRIMVFGSPEQFRAIEFRLPTMSHDLTLMLAPLAVGILWFRFEGYRKYNWDLLMSYLGIIFCVLITLVPPRPGYFLWSLPFLTYQFCRWNKSRPTALLIYTAAYLAFFWTAPESDLVDAWRTILPGVAESKVDRLLQGVLHSEYISPLRSLIFTVMVAAMSGMTLSMYFNGVRSNEYYRIRQRPTLIALAGDSGSGKDKTSELLAAALGRDRVLLISGDDYHRWPRNHDIWHVLTHLDGRANDLKQQHEDALRIKTGDSIYKGSYDHNTGQFTDPRWVDPRDYIILAGLHSLSTEAQRSLCDLKVFLDPHESLNLAWKIHRDGRERGYTPGQVMQKIREREADRVKYIKPQVEVAEVVVRFLPQSPLNPASPDALPSLSLEIIAKNSFWLVPLLDRLRDQSLLQVEHEPLQTAQLQRLCLSGTIAADELRALAEWFIPSFDEISAKPEFSDDLNGCLQLIILACLSYKLQWLKLEAKTESNY